MNRQKIKVESASVKLVPHRSAHGVDSIASLGRALAVGEVGEILVPAVVRDRRTQQYIVIGGERRWLAMQRYPALPDYVIVCDVWADYLAWLILDKYREHPGYPARPMPVTDIVGLTSTLTYYLHPGRDDRMDSTLAEYFGIRDSRISEARSIQRVKDSNQPPEIRELVEAEWAAVAKGEASPSAAFQRIRRAQERLTAPPADVKVQRGKLSGAVSVCTGLVDGLSNFGDASPELRDDEVEHYITYLSDARRALESVIRKLRERAA